MYHVVYVVCRYTRYFNFGVRHFSKFIDQASSWVWTGFLSREHVRITFSFQKQLVSSENSFLFLQWTWWRQTFSAYLLTSQRLAPPSKLSVHYESLNMLFFKRCATAQIPFNRVIWRERCQCMIYQVYLMHINIFWLKKLTIISRIHKL